MKPRDGAEACLFCCSSHGIRHIGSHIGSAWAFFHTSGMHCGCRRLKQSYGLLAPDPLEDIIPHYDLRANNAPPTVLPIKNTLPMEIVLRVSVCPSNTRVHVPNDVRHTGISTSESAPPSITHGSSDAHLRVVDERDIAAQMRTATDVTVRVQRN